MTVKSDKALIVFVKNPVIGRVKTRLAATIGDKKAFDIYIQLLSHAIAVAEKTDADLVLCYSDFIPQNDEWSSLTAQRCKQKGNNLGACMRNALSDILKVYKHAVLIGSDCAELTTEILDGAFDSLSNADVIIGPALDGGYYLVGVNQPTPEIFNDIDWSTSRVLHQTISRLLDCSLNFALAQTLRDVDTSEDLESLRLLI